MAWEQPPSEDTFWCRDCGRVLCDSHRYQHTCERLDALKERNDTWLQLLGRKCQVPKTKSPAQSGWSVLVLHNVVYVYVLERSNPDMLIGVRMFNEAECWHVGWCVSLHYASLLHLVLHSFPLRQFEMWYDVIQGQDYERGGEPASQREISHGLPCEPLQCWHILTFFRGAIAPKSRFKLIWGATCRNPENGSLCQNKQSLLFWYEMYKELEGIVETSIW